MKKIRLSLVFVLVLVEVEVEVQETNSLLFQEWVGGVEEWRIKLTSAKVEVEVELSQVKLD